MARQDAEPLGFLNFDCGDFGSSDYRGYWKTSCRKVRYVDVARPPAISSARNHQYPEKAVLFLNCVSRHNEGWAPLADRAIRVGKGNLDDIPGAKDRHRLADPRLSPIPQT